MEVQPFNNQHDANAQHVRMDSAGYKFFHVVADMCAMIRQASSLQNEIDTRVYPCLFDACAIWGGRTTGSRVVAIYSCAPGFALSPQTPSQARLQGTTERHALFKHNLVTILRCCSRRHKCAELSCSQTLRWLTLLDLNMYARGHSNFEC